jgi:hypothetical protein
MERFVKVELPINNSDDTLKLCTAVVAKDTLRGATSPLNGFVDMAAFETKRASAETKRQQANAAREDSEALHGQAMDKCGISEGLNRLAKDTVYWYVLQVRDILLPKNRGVEQNLEDWGFNVVISQTGGRRNIRVDVPTRNPDELLTLAEAIIAQDTDLGAASPLTGNVDMTAFGALTTDARTLLTQADSKRADKEALNGQAAEIIGYAIGQTSFTPGTLYYYLVIIRDRLLQISTGVEQNLEQWGFHVVIHGHSVGGGKGQGSMIVLQGDVPAGGIANINTDSVVPTTQTGISITVTGSALRFYAGSVPAAIPGPATPLLDVLPGIPYQSTLEEFMNFLGFTDTDHYLTVQNTGITTGHYQLTFTNVQ